MGEEKESTMTSPWANAPDIETPVEPDKPRHAFAYVHPLDYDRVLAFLKAAVAHQKEVHLPKHIAEVVDDVFPSMLDRFRPDANVPLNHMWTYEAEFSDPNEIKLTDQFIGFDDPSNLCVGGLVIVKALLTSIGYIVEIGHIEND